MRVVSEFFDAIGGESEGIYSSIVVASPAVHLAVFLANHASAPTHGLEVAARGGEPHGLIFKTNISKTFLTGPQHPLGRSNEYRVATHTDCEGINNMSPRCVRRTRGAGYGNSIET